MAPIVPPIAAKLGMERTLGAALCMLAVAIVIRSMPSPITIWVGTAGLGIAIAFLNVIVPSLIKRDFPARVGSITGMYSSFQSAAAAIASGLAVPIAGDQPSGWRLALGIWAGLALIALAAFAPHLRSTTRPKHTVSAAFDSHPEQYKSPWRSALGWQVTIFMAIQSTFFFALVTWLPSIEEANGVTAALAGWHLFVFQMLAVVGNIATAALIHRFTNQQAIAAVATVAMAIGVLGAILSPSWILLWVCIAGFGAGASIVLALSLFGLRTAHHGQAAALSGMAQGVGYLLAALGPIAIGWLHDSTKGWTSSLVALLVLLGFQLVAGLLAGRDRTIERNVVQL
ncbi:MAG: MFS transporter [Comamonadaceae bacterium]|nr:MAG: MFS transporter [Comamonadaceae bacterium]